MRDCSKDQIDDDEDENTGIPYTVCRLDIHASRPIGRRQEWNGKQRAWGTPRRAIIDAQCCR